ncbi:O-methyltransferase [Flavobacterium terrigena]|uniref:Methyltransferase domain-containing protein n=1 Tax=Flavobacterium terrigena TaxID=402734 RepID=A0A1H6RSR7_9FLAO|nr:class I SAM-dependent methyltransferase [Flavobacterium terrigena]SEI57496.1 Methyltransferase domain-containing protein [Flavobacterium terrigena]
MLQQIKSYIKFLYHSKNEHGVHSPFVFNLITKCFYDKVKFPEYSTLKNYRNALLANKNTIEVTDFGAGSRVFKSNTREISKIAKNAGISPKNAELLFRIVKYFQPESILEIGTSLGLATSALSLGKKNSKIITLEGCPNTLAIAEKMFQVSSFKLPKNTIQFVNTEFSSYFKNLKPETLNKPQIFDLIYFDGNHSQKATLEYFELLLPTITNDSVWIFDDIHWSEEMENTWETIKKHPKVKVTIDTFQWGIVFFRAEQEKEHFVINPDKSFLSRFYEFCRL